MADICVIDQMSDPAWRRATTGEHPVSTKMTGRQYVKRLQEVAASAREHAALRNGFYERWKERPLNADQLRVMGVNFEAWIEPTVERLVLALLVIKGIDARAEIVENLSDELGRGNSGKAHIRLLRGWLNTIFSPVSGGETLNFDADDNSILPATRRLTEESLKLCGSMGPLVATGAILAQEHHAYSQLVNLYEGSRQYMSLYDLDEFHERSEYVYIHIGSAEKEHKDQSIRMAALACQTEEDFEKIVFGFQRFLELLADYWRGLAEAIEKLEPRAA